MEYEKNGKNKTKSATTYLKIGDDPYQAIEGGFVDNKGMCPIALAFIKWLCLVYRHLSA